MAWSEGLRPDRALLNPKFDGYKLSSDQLEAHSVSLPCQVNIVRLRDDVFSHLHVKAFAWANHLILDQWCEDKKMLYLVDENYSVNQIIVQDGKVKMLSKVFEIPAVEEETLHHLNAFLSFPSNTHAVLSDGTGQLYVVHTGVRLEANQWSIACTHNVGKPFSILHSNIDPNSKSLACLLLSVSPDEDKGSLHVKHTVLLTVVVFSSEVSENGKLQFCFEVHKEFQSHSVPLYGALESNNQRFIVASERPFSLVTDKHNKDSLDETFEDTKTAIVPENGSQSEPRKEYTWMQGSDNVTIVFPLPKNANKDDILFEIKTKWLKVSFKETSLLMGELFADVKADLCTWTTEKQRLEITLTKSHSSEVWTAVVKGDQRGIYRVDEKNLFVFDDITKIVGNEPSILFNQSELEECDSVPEDVLYIAQMDVNNGNITQKTSLSTHQWLFTKTINPRDPPAFCIRHDVDALIWQPNETEGRVTWKHIGTLDAFGFVHASKKDQTFTSCSPDMSYAVICDVRNHVFTYHRHSMQDAVHAKQKLLQLDNVGSAGIIGVQACDDVIFVLAKEKLFILSSF